MAKKENKKEKSLKGKVPKGPKLKNTWLVWITLFGLGIGFLTFGNVRFYTKERVRKVDMVPVWTQTVTETVTTSFKTDSNNTHSTGGYLNYGGGSARGGALINYNTEFNYYGFELPEDQLSDTLRIYFQVDHYYFRQFAPEGYKLDRSLSYFNYYFEIGSNLISSVPDYGSSGLTSFDLTPGIIHSLSYSEIAARYTYSTTSLNILVEKVDRFNNDPADNFIKFYPSVDLTFTRNNFVDVNLKSYTIFEVDEKITKKSEMVLDYEEKVTYYYEYKLNMSMDEFSTIGTNLFNNLAGYLGKLLDVWDVVFGILQGLYEFITDTFVNLINKIADFFLNLGEGVGNILGDIKEGVGNIWDYITNLGNTNNSVIIYTHTNNSIVLRR